MPRYNLMDAREKKDLSQQDLANRVHADRRTVIAWENGTRIPQAYYRRKIREVLNNDDPHLFDDLPIGASETQGASSCVTSSVSDRLDSSDSHQIDVLSESSEETDMDPRRRKINTTIAVGTIAASTGIALVNNVPIITGFIIDPALYLQQARLAIDTAWRDINSGNYLQVTRAINAHSHTLGQVAYSPTPFQQQAASLAVEMKILQIFLANRDMQFAQRELYCIEAVQFGALSDDRNLYALAQYWLGDTFTYCYNRPQTAIEHLSDALASVDGNSLLRSAIYSDMSIANAQNRDEKKSLDYAEMARLTMPSHPELNPLYESVGIGPSELDQFEGKTLLYLAGHFSSGYAQKAYDLLDKSTSQKATSKGFLTQALIRKADAARLLNNRDECIDNLTQAYEKAPSISRLNQIDKVLSRMPDNWQWEKSVAGLQKKIANTLETARG